MFFGIVRLVKLDAIIDDVLNNLKNEKYEYKEELINNITEKKKLLKKLLDNYNDVKETYLQFDKLYRDLFNFYLIRYVSEGSTNERTRFTAIMNNIQTLLSDKFSDFRHSYFTIRNSFFEANK